MIKQGLIVRSYAPTDFDAVSELITAASRVDRTRRIPESTLRRALTPDANGRSIPETLVVARPNGPVTGFAWWEITGSEDMRFEGWVHPDERRKGYGTALLTGIESAVRRHFKRMVLSGRAYEDIPGVLPLFALRGYTPARKFYMMFTSLKDRDLTIEPPSGVTLRYFKHEDLETLVEADNTIFTDHWGSYPRSVEAWRRDMIEERPHDPALWIVAWAGDYIVAECLCHASREGGPNDGWVSVVGVRREWRGRGLGRTVLARGLKALQNAGFDTASLSVDAENISAINLYRSLEMDITRTRTHFQKALS